MVNAVNLACKLGQNLPMYVLVISCLMLMSYSAPYGFDGRTDPYADDVIIDSNVTLGSYVDAVASEWGPAVATWYGEPDGFGSDGGACGYGADVGKAPFSSMVSAGGPSLFLSGKGCGTCYQVKCSANDACSGNPVTVVITDNCAGGPCASDATHFDLSGTAFGALASSGQEDTLRNAGSIDIEFQRVECSYPETPLTFKIDSGSNPNYLAVLIEYVSGDGDVAQVELQETSVSDSWLPMQQSWGAVWALNSGSPLQGPFSIRITTSAADSLVAENVIPADWAAGGSYTADVSF
uniref:Uncharacterized protein n=1 Tax=Kalanchoe fedtschenkoi TaxID=63787 RepID=A0A7N1A3F8_KALFE